MSNRQASLYWIHLPDHTDCRTQGYIGVSLNAKNRFVHHLKSLIANTHKNPHLVHAFKRHGWDTLIKEELLVGIESYCYMIETKLRPTKGIGWNISIGGLRGPGWPKGKKHSDATKAKLAITRKKKTEELLKTKELARAKRLEEKLALKAAKKQQLETEKLERKAARKKATLERQEATRAKLQSNQTKNDMSMPISLFDNKPTCPSCRVRPAAINYVRDDVIYYRKLCTTCARLKIKLAPPLPNWAKTGYKKKPQCEKCGFKLKFDLQSVVYYTDGDSTNTTHQNLKTVCLNCQVDIRLTGGPWKTGDLIPDY